MNVFITYYAVLQVIWSPGESRSPVDVTAYGEVYEAAVQYLTRPGGDGAALVIGSTINVCSAEERHPMGCLVKRWLDSIPNRGLFSEQERESIISKILKDNANSYPISETGSGSIRIVSESEFRAIAEAEEKPAEGYFGFSLPAILEDGRAMLYAVYYSGSLSGKGWVLTLEYWTDGWRVIGCDSVWIS